MAGAAAAALGGRRVSRRSVRSVGCQNGPATGAACQASRIAAHKIRRLRCWRGGGNRLSFARRCAVTTGGLWMVSRACLHKAGNRASCLRIRRFEPPLRMPPRRSRRRKNVRRVRRHLYHHLSGARGVHFPAAAQRLGPAHRPRAAALRSLFGARRGAQPGGRQSRDAAAAPGRNGTGAAGRALRRRRRDRWKASPKRIGRSRPGSMRSRPRTRASTPSISSPARARPTR